MSIKKVLKPCVRPAQILINHSICKISTFIEKSRYLPLGLRSNSEGAGYIAVTIRDGNAAAIGKIGSAELKALRQFLCGNASATKKTREDWRKGLNVNAGVHPCSDESFNVFFHEYSEALQQLDLLGVWYNEGEASVAKRFCQNAIFSHYWCLEPYYHKAPWSAELKGKKVLIMSPFVDSIKEQYKKRDLVWEKSPGLLPDFSIITIKVPLSDAIVKSPYESWKVCLEDLKAQMNAVDFDVVLIGAGAYSLPLCAHAKSLGKIGIHMGGSLQIMFGVLGNRWANHSVISAFFNEHWCHPNADESPNARVLIEGGCYW